MKKYAVKIIAVVLMVLAIAGVIIRVNSASLALTLGGYSGDVVIIEEGFTHISDTSRWQVLLAEKDGETRLAVMEQGFLGFWKLPEAATGLNGEYEGLEYITVSTLPPCGHDYGYDPYVIADTMTHTDNWKFATEQVGPIGSTTAITQHKPLCSQTAPCPKIVLFKFTRTARSMYCTCASIVKATAPLTAGLMKFIRPYWTTVA